MAIISGGAAAGGSQAVQRITTDPIAAAAILDLRANPPVVVTCPAPTSAVVPICGTAYLEAGGTVFDFPNVTWGLCYDGDDPWFNGGIFAVEGDHASDFNAAIDTLVQAYTTETTFVNKMGKDLVFNITNDTGPTVGNGTITWDVLYWVWTPPS